MSARFVQGRWQWWVHEWRDLHEHRLLLPNWAWRVLLTAVLLLLVLFVSPYWTLWRLSRAASEASAEALAPFVDLDAVRDEIRRRLNKDLSSRIGEVSDPFIEWIERGLQRKGTATIEHIATFEWIAGLLRGNDEAQPLLKRVRYAFYHPPHGFLVKIEHESGNPVILLLNPELPIWRVTAVSY